MLNKSYWKEEEKNMAFDVRQAKKKEQNKKNAYNYTGAAPQPNHCI